MAERRLALIVASYQYEDPELQQLVAPPRDAEALARVLSDPAIGDFQVQTLLNEPSYRVNQAIEGFFTGSRRDDLLLLYFSGHGVKDEDGQLHFAVADTQQKLLGSTGVWSNFVNRVMLRSRSRRQVLLLDCCYSGAFAKGMVAKADRSMGIGERFEGRGRVIVTSSDAMQYAFEGDDVQGEDVRSVFTRVLVQGLETGDADLNKDGNISIDELYEYVCRHVTEEVPEQQPRKWTLDALGEIVVAYNPVPAEPKGGSLGRIKEALASRSRSMGLTVVSELERMCRSEAVDQRGAAHAELERLSRDDQDPIVRDAAAQALRALSLTRSPPVVLSGSNGIVWPAEITERHSQTREQSTMQRSEDSPGALGHEGVKCPSCGKPVSYSKHIDTWFGDSDGYEPRYVKGYVCYDCEWYETSAG